MDQNQSPNLDLEIPESKNQNKVLDIILWIFSIIVILAVIGAVYYYVELIYKKQQSQIFQTIQTNKN